MKEDRPMQYELNAIADLCKSGKVLEIAEGVVGPLE